MCGVVGYIPIKDETWTQRELAIGKFKDLFYESTIRGKHFYGISQPSIQHPDGHRSNFDVWKSAYASTIPEQFDPRRPAVAHTRFSQSGDWRVKNNNQPLVVNQICLAMNGVIHMGTQAEYEAEFNVKCAADNDAEIFLRKLTQGVGAFDFIHSISGSFAGVWMNSEGQIWAMRNSRRPLWMCGGFGAVWIASTKDIFERAGFSEEKFELNAGVLYENMTGVYKCNQLIKSHKSEKARKNEITT